MDFHYNLYYIFKEDQQKHPPPPHLKEALWRKLEDVRSETGPPGKPTSRPNIF